MNFKFVGLITGGRWHLEAYRILRANKKKIIIFDDNKNFYIKKYLKKDDSFYNISEANKFKIKHKSNIFFWSPINDYGALISDRLNYQINKKRIRTPINLKNINKEIIKKKLILNKIKVPRKIKEKEFGLLKKINGSGSRNIFLTKRDKVGFYKEEYIKGIEISVETISFRKKHRIIATSLRILANYKSAECILLLKKASKNKSIIHNKINNILNALKIINGSCHIELILNSKNELIPIDCNIRAGGSGISSIFINKTIKINLLKLDYHSLIGKYTSIKVINGYGAIFYYSNINKNIKKNYRDKNFYFEKFKKYNSQNKNNDLGRKSLLIINNANKNKFFNIFNKYIKKNSQEIILKKWNYLNDFLF